MSKQSKGKSGGGPASGLPARGYSWPPFEQGNDVAVRHGAYATVKLGARVDELAAELRELVPGYRAADEPMLRIACVALARLEASMVALEDAKPGELERLQADARGWLNSLRRILNDLGMSPSARARLGVDVAVAQRAMALTELAIVADDERRRESESEPEQ